MNSLSTQHLNALLGRRPLPMRHASGNGSSGSPLSLSMQLDHVRERMNRVRKGGSGRRGALQCLVAESAYWYGHPQGPARAPKHSDRLQIGPYGHELEFGANKFLVERALDSCLQYIDRCLDWMEKSGRKAAWDAARPDLALRVADSVSNHCDELFGGLYPRDSRGYMHFGTQAIHVDGFVACLYERLELHRVFRPQ